MARISLSLTEKSFKNPYFFRVIRQIRVLKKRSFREMKLLLFARADGKLLSHPSSLPQGN